MSKPAYVQSVFEFAIREINALEARIVRAEDDADAMLWEQAASVVAQLDAGMTQRQMAAQWLNVRNENKPYSLAHVSYVRQVVVQFTEQNPRPRFRDVYNAIANTKAPHVAQNSGNNEWYTPPVYLDAARATLEDIDLDPATSLTANELVRAARIFTTEQDGLSRSWLDPETGSCGRVWMNPPYSHPEIEQFTDRFVCYVQAGQLEAGVVLVNNATETQWFRKLADVADAACFLTGRVQFLTPDHASTGSPLQGQVLLYFGTETPRFLRACAPLGLLVVRP